MPSFKKLSFTLTLMLLVLNVAQGQYQESTTRHWVLGDQIHVNTSNNNVQTNALNVDGESPEGTAVWFPPRSPYTNAPGDDFYYTNGETVWRATHQSGNSYSHSVEDNLGGDRNAAQTAVFVPRYNGSTSYEVYAVTSGGSLTTTHSFGNTGVSGLSRAISVICQSDPNKMWILSMNSSKTQMVAIERTRNLSENPFGGSYYTYNPINSNSGISGAGSGSAVIVSPQLSNGQFYVAACVENYGVHMYSFDPTFGSFTSLGKVPNSTSSYYGAFSSNGNMFYFTNSTTGYLVGNNIYRHSVGSGTSASIGGSGYSGMQLTENGVIYVSGNGKTSLGIISNPNSSTATFNENGLFLEGGQLNYGVPNAGVCYNAGSTFANPGQILNNNDSDGTFNPDRLYMRFCPGEDPLPTTDASAGSGGTYQWERNPWSESSGPGGEITDDNWSVIPGATGEDYTPVPSDFIDEDGDPTDHVAFRRRIVGVCCGNIVTEAIHYEPYYIELGLIEGDQTFCVGETPPEMGYLGNGFPYIASSNNSASYVWQETETPFDFFTWNTVKTFNGTANTTADINYTPTAFNQAETNYYRLLITFDVCPNSTFVAPGTSNVSYDFEFLGEPMDYANESYPNGHENNGGAVLTYTSTNGPTITSTNVNCNSTTSGTITINATGTGLEYKLDNGNYQTSNSFSTTNGSHTVFVRNSAGCESSQAVTVDCSCSAPSPTNINASPSTICSGDNSTLSASIASGNTIRWYTNPSGTGTPIGTGNSISVSPTNTTTYYAFGFNTSQNCQSSGSASVTVTVSAAPNNPSVTGAVTASCPNNTYLLINAIQGGTGGNTPYYNTTNSSSGSLLLTSSTAVPPGQYYIFFRNSTGCYSGGSSVVVLDGNCGCPGGDPTANAGPDATICQGGSHQLQGSIGGGASSGTWTSINGGTFSPNANSLNATFTPTASFTGTIVLRLTTNDPDGSGTSCSAAFDEMTLTVVANPVINNVQVVQNATSPCPNPDNGSINIDATGSGLEYSINGVSYQNSSFFSGLTPGNYTAYVRTTSGGCLATENFVIIDDCSAGCTTPTSANAGPNQSSCGTDVVTLNGSVSGGTGIWTTSGSGTFGNANSASTTYTPSTADVNAGSVTLTLSVPDPDGNGPCTAASDQMILTIIANCQPGCNFSAPNGTNYQWKVITGTTATNLPGETNQSFNTNEPGAYCATFTNTSNQLDTSNLFVVICSSGDPNNTTATFNAPTGSGFNYQWFNNGVIINGATNASYTTSTSGVFTVEVSKTDCVVTYGPYTVCATDCSQPCANPPTVGITNPLPNDEQCFPNAIGFFGEFANADFATWSIISGGGTISPTNCGSTNCLTSYTASSPGAKTIRIQTNDPDGSGVCEAAVFDYTFTMNPQPDAPVVDPQIENDCSNNETTADLTAAVQSNTPPGGTIRYVTTNNPEGPGVPNPTSVGAGTYYVFYRSADGCYSEGSAIQVTINNCNCANPPTAFISSTLVNDASCGLGPVSLVGEFSNAGFATWSIVSGGGSLSSTSCANTNCPVTYTPTATGTKVVRLTTNDPDGNGPCIAASFDYTFTINAQPNAPIVTSPISNVCPATTADLTDAVNDTPPQGGSVFYKLTNNPVGQNVSNPEMVGAGTYYVFYQSAQGCYSEGSEVIVNIDDCGCQLNHSATISTPSTTPVTVCPNEPITLVGQVSGANFGSWSDNGAGGTFSSQSLNTVYTPANNATGPITITLSTDDPDGPGVCEPEMDELVLNFYVVPVISGVTGNDPDNCTSGADNGSIEVTLSQIGSGGTEFRLETLTGTQVQDWTVGVTPFTFNNLVPNTYRVLVRSANGSCMGQSQTVTLNDNCLELCDMTAPSGSNYQWFTKSGSTLSPINGANAQTYSTNVPAVYCAIFTNTSNQTDTSDMFIVLCQSGDPSVTNLTLDVTNMGGVDHQWFTGEIGSGQPIPGATNSVYNVTTGGVYYVTVTTSADCEKDAGPWRVCYAECEACTTPINITAVASSDPTTCDGTEGTITLTLTGLTPGETYAVSYLVDGISDAQAVTPTGNTLVLTGLVAGTYTNLTVQLATCISNTWPNTIILEDPIGPNADFNFSTPTIVGSSIAFTDQSSAGDGSINAWLWDFGNGNISNQQNPTHTYTTAGTYLVCLVVTDNNGCTDQYCRSIVVQDANCMAEFSVSPFNAPNGSACLDDQLTFNATASVPSNSAQITSYDWDFGNGATASGSIVTYQYPAPGAYSVTLTITDDNNCSNMKTIIVNVQDCGPDCTDPDNCGLEACKPNPTVILPPSDATSCDNPDGSITFKGFIPDDVYTISYELNGQSTNVNIQANSQGDLIFASLEPGTYNPIVIFNQVGCMSDNLGPITIDAPITINIGTPTVVNPSNCPNPNNGTITVNTTTMPSNSGNLQYTLSGQLDRGPQGSPFFGNLEPGIYFINVVDAITGCSASNAPVQVELTAPAGCEEDCETTGDEDGDGFADCEDSDCEPKISIAFPMSPTTCVPGNDGQIQFLGNFIDGELYGVSFIKAGSGIGAVGPFTANNGSITATGLDEGTYTFTIVKLSTGCESDPFGPVILENPEGPFVSNVKTTIADNCPTLDNGTAEVQHLQSNPNFEYQLLGNDPDVGNFQSSPLFTGLQAGSYALNVRDVTTGCLTNYSEPVIIDAIQDCQEICDDPAGNDEDGDGLANCADPSCQPATFEVQGGGEFCSNEIMSGVISISGQESDVTYELRLGSTVIDIRLGQTGGGVLTFPVTLTQSGVYEVFGISSAGCEVKMVGNANIVVNNGPSATFITGPGRVCPNGLIELTASWTDGDAAIASVTWFKNSAIVGSSSPSNPVLEVTDGGQYHVVIVDVNGCSDTSAIFTVQSGTPAQCEEDCRTTDDDNGNGLGGCDDAEACVPVIDDVIIRQPECPLSDHNAEIIIIAQGGSTFGTLLFSIDDGVNYQTNNTFTDNVLVPGGSYTIKVRNTDGNCVAEWPANPVVLDMPDCPEICNNGVDDDGDGMKDQYDEEDCIVQIDDVVAIDPTCEEGGQITVLVVQENGEDAGTGVNGIVEYRIRSLFNETGFPITIGWQTSNTFTGLPFGFYDIEVRNTEGGWVTEFNQNPIELVEPICELCISPKVWLQGPWNGINMDVTDIANSFYIPLRNCPNGQGGVMLPTAQPYGTEPWNYFGSEVFTGSFDAIDALDWTLVEVRSSRFPEDVVFRAAGMLNEDGLIYNMEGGQEFCFDITGIDTAYTVIRHRNHLPIMTRIKDRIDIRDANGTVLLDGSVVDVDFRDLQTYREVNDLPVENDDYTVIGASSGQRNLPPRNANGEVDYVGLGEDPDLHPNNPDPTFQFGMYAGNVLSFQVGSGNGAFFEWDINNFEYEVFEEDFGLSAVYLLTDANLGCDVESQDYVFIDRHNGISTEIFRIGNN